MGRVILSNDLTKFGINEILSVRPVLIDRFLTAAEVQHLIVAHGSGWFYDYDALAKGKPGLHAILKSEFHSDAFFNLKDVLKNQILCEIFARQIVMKLKKSGIRGVDFVIGVPEAATELGKKVADLLDVGTIPIRKVDGKMVIDDVYKKLIKGKIVLVIEDLCTKGTGVTEFVLLLLDAGAIVIPDIRYILNRGGMPEVPIAGNDYKVSPLVEIPISDWKAEECPLCMAWSDPIKPKELPENWETLMNSQK